MASLATLDDVAEMLEATGSFKVLRRVPVRPDIERPLDPGDLRIGVIVDVEATGPDPERDVPIEIAMIKFGYESGTDRVLGLIDIFLTKGEPPAPLSPEVVALTGLTDEQLRGLRIDEEGVVAFLEDAVLVCSHNAAYDRVILERNLVALPLRPWACTLHDIPWKEEGQLERRLRDLLTMHGLFEGGHRAMADCRSLLHILSLPLPSTGRTAFAVMLAAARKMSAVFFAEGAPFAATPLLRDRGYRWLGSQPGAPRCWARQVSVDDARAEAAFLFASVYPRGDYRRLTVTMLSAVHRYRPMQVIAAARVVAPFAPVEEDA